MVEKIDRYGQTHEAGYQHPNTQYDPSGHQQAGTLSSWKKNLFVQTDVRLSELLDPDVLAQQTNSTPRQGSAGGQKLFFSLT